jgi:hypothetical protein
MIPLPSITPSTSSAALSSASTSGSVFNVSGGLSDYSGGTIGDLLDSYNSVSPFAAYAGRTRSDTYSDWWIWLIVAGIFLWLVVL